MNLRLRLQSMPCTLSDLFLAAEQRYWDGIYLAVHARSSAAIYSFGFAVEMWLKYACLRYDGRDPADVWNVGSFKHAERYMMKSGATVAPESWHSLRFFSQYLRTRRMRGNRPLEPGLDAALVHRTNRLYGVWLVGMRYFPEYASEYDLRRAYDDAGWFRENVETLWR